MILTHSAFSNSKRVAKYCWSSPDAKIRMVTASRSFTEMHFLNHGSFLVILSRTKFKRPSKNFRRHPQITKKIFSIIQITRKIFSIIQITKKIFSIIQITRKIFSSFWWSSDIKLEYSQSINFLSLQKQQPCCKKSHHALQEKHNFLRASMEQFLRQLKAKLHLLHLKHLSKNLLLGYETNYF